MHINDRCQYYIADKELLFTQATLHKHNRANYLMWVQNISVKDTDAA